MDKVWDSLASQTAFGDAGVEDTTAEERFAAAARLKALREERDRLEARCRKERQFTRKTSCSASCGRSRSRSRNWRRAGLISKVNLQPIRRRNQEF